MNPMNVELKKYLDKLNIKELNAMQLASVDTWSKGKDVVLLSPTGTGKTLAYLLPILQELDAQVQGVQALVLVPSRELAIQIDEVVKKMGTPYKSVCCYGGRPAMDEHRTINGVQPSIIIGTPGRINDHLKKRNIPTQSLTTLVIDEFDKSLELGFHDEMQQVLQQLPQLKRRFLLSATDAIEIPEFVGADRSIRLDFLPESKEDTRQIEHLLVSSPQKDKLETLYKLLCHQSEGRTLVFVNYRESVDRVGKFLQEKNLPCGMFHGGMEQMDRERALYRFRNGSCKVLVSTDLAARGLDIEGVNQVVHYHLPLNEEAYIHRSGRTARWDAKGLSFLLLHAEETVPEYVAHQIKEFDLPEVTPKPSIPDYITIYIGKGKKDKVNKIDIVGFLSKKGNLGRDDIGRVDVMDHYAYAAVKTKIARQLLQLVRGEKIKGMKTIIEYAK